MNVLHLCNDFLGSRVHYNLIRELDHSGINQTIFYPVREKNINKKQFESESFKVIYSKRISKFHRIFFRRKIAYLYNSLVAQIQPKEYQFIHATTLLSDGYLAYLLWQKHRVPYIVSIRGTDVNLFLRYRPDLIHIIRKIVKNASQLIFISDSLKNNFSEHFLIRNFVKPDPEKIKVIPNGIDNAYLDHVRPFEKKAMQINKLMYVGRFDNNKNVERLIQATEDLKVCFPELTLTLIGGGGNHHKKVLQLIQTKPYILFKGPIYNSAELIQEFRNHDIFAMISHSETFGLVYVEALSQGIPIIFSKGQGIDGYFKNFVGYPAESQSIKSIANAIKKLIKEYEQLEINDIKFNQFRWTNIAQQYLEIYRKSPSL